MTLLLHLNQFYKTEQGVGSSPNRNSCCSVVDFAYYCSALKGLTELVWEMNSLQLANWRKEYLVNHVKMTSCCLQGLSPFLRSNSSTNWNLEMLGDSVITCGAVLAQMLKGEKHFANTVPCNTQLSSQSHCSHFQTKTGHFYIVCLRLIVCTYKYIYIFFFCHLNF